jgi:hypothetical protein
MPSVPEKPGQARPRPGRPLTEFLQKKTRNEKGWHAGPVGSDTLINNQSVAPDGPSMPLPIKKESSVAGKQEGQTGSPLYRQLG